MRMQRVSAIRRSLQSWMCSPSSYVRTVLASFEHIVIHADRSCRAFLDIETIHILMKFK